MSRVRIRFEINKGRIGAPLAKLARLAEQLERFLVRLAADCAIPARPGEWLALNFDNGSVSYDAEFQGEVAETEAQAFHRALDYVTAFDPARSVLNGIVSSRTMTEYAQIGTIIDPDESVGIGLYGPANGSVPYEAPEWRQIPYSRLAAIRTEIEVAVTAHGAVQGLIHSWFKEAERPYFRLRELSTWVLVNCHYPPSLYAEVVKAIRERSTVVIVYGSLKYDRVSRATREIAVDRIEPVETLSSEEFDRLFGSAPRFTGDHTTEEFVEWMRDDG